MLGKFHDDLRYVSNYRYCPKVLEIVLMGTVKCLLGYFHNMWFKRLLCLCVKAMQLFNSSRNVLAREEESGSGEAAKQAGACT